MVKIKNSYDSEKVNYHLSRALNLSSLERILDMLNRGHFQLATYPVIGLRHAPKEELHDEDARASDLGLHVAEKYAQIWTSFPVRIETIDYSPKERAMQTAERFARILGVAINRDSRLQPPSFRELANTTEDEKLNAIVNNEKYGDIELEGARALASYFASSLTDTVVAKLAISHSPHLNFLPLSLRFTLLNPPFAKIFNEVKKSVYIADILDLNHFHSYATIVIPELNGYALVKVNVDSEPALAFIDNDGIILMERDSLETILKK